jgi:hypothetical protein
LRRLLSQAERALAQATETCQRLGNELAAAGGDHQLLARLSAELAEAQSKVDAAEESWLALAAEAELQGLTVD